MVACYVQPCVGLSHGSQIAAARRLLGMTLLDLKRESGVGVKTINRLEKSGRHLRGRISSLVKIQTALEKLRIEFVDDNGELGVILKPPEPRKKR